VGKDQTVPYGTDFRSDVFQAINCLATINCPSGTKAIPQKFYVPSLLSPTPGVYLPKCRS
jgi:hypothetical protein